MRIALCYFGLPRGLAQAAPSLRACLEAPLRAQGAEVIRLAHVYTHSAEPGEEVARIDTLLDLDGLETERPEPGGRSFDALLRQGDYWGDGGRSLRNLLLQLQSLDRVTEMACAAGAEACLFARPDLLYHDPVPDWLVAEAAAARAPGIRLPVWQHWKGGLNDRFAFCHGAEAIATYGMRRRLAQDFCVRTGSALQSERLVAWALWCAAIPWRPLPMRASRVRAGGHVLDEDFRPHPLRRLRQKARLRAAWLARGLRPGLGAPDPAQAGAAAE